MQHPPQTIEMAWKGNCKWADFFFANTISKVSLKRPGNMSGKPEKLM